MIAKYTNNLYSSEVYRELERQAVRKGHFKPSEEQVVKTAAAQVQQQEAINKPVDTTPSDDLAQDVARLAFAMRRKGYVRQAEDLEEKLVLFKKAERELYNVTPEKNSDFIQFSHRDGDKDIIEGAGELGVIETIDSLADKIRAVTQKEPTGKLPGKSASMNELAELIKNSETTENDIRKSYRLVINKIESFPQISGFRLGQQMANTNFADNPAAARVYAAVGGVSEQAVMKASQTLQAVREAGMNQQNFDTNGFYAFLQNNISDANPVRAVAELLNVETQSVRKGSIGQVVVNDGSVFDSVDQVAAKWPKNMLGQKFNYSQVPKSTPTSIWGARISNDINVRVIGYYLIPDRARAYAAKLAEGWKRIYEPAYGQNYSKAREVQAELDKMPANLFEAIQKTKPKVPQGVIDETFGDIDVRRAVEPIYQSQKEIGQIMTSDLGTNTIAAMKAFGASDSAQKVVGWYKEMGSVFSQAQKIISSEFETIDVSGVINQMNKAMSYWREAGRIAGRNSDARVSAQQNIDAVRDLLNSISAVGAPGQTKKPKTLLMPVLKANDYADLNSLTTELEGIVEQAKADLDAVQNKAGE